MMSCNVYAPSASRQQKSKHCFLETTAMTSVKDVMASMEVVTADGHHSIINGTNETPITYIFALCVGYEVRVVECSAVH